MAVKALPGGLGCSGLMRYFQTFSLVCCSRSVLHRRSILPNNRQDVLNFQMFSAEITDTKLLLESVASFVVLQRLL